MVDNDPKDPPFARSKRIQHLHDTLVNQKSGKQRRPSDSKYINRESDLAECFHAQTNSGARRKMRLSGGFACVVPAD
jgi:hypothetical protein